MKLRALTKLARQFAASDGIDAREAKTLLAKGAKDPSALRVDESRTLRALEERLAWRFTPEGRDEFHVAVERGSRYPRERQLELIGELDRLAPNGKRLGARQARALFAHLVTDPQRPHARDVDVVTQVDSRFLHRFTPQGKRAWEALVLGLYERCQPGSAR